MINDVNNTNPSVLSIGQYIKEHFCIANDVSKENVCFLNG